MSQPYKSSPQKTMHHVVAIGVFFVLIFNGGRGTRKKKTPQEIEFHFCLIAAGCNFDQRLGHPLFNLFELANDWNHGNLRVPPRMPSPTGNKALIRPY